MKKQVLTFLTIALLSNFALANNKALNTVSAGYARTTVAPFTGSTNAFTFETWFKGSSGTTYARLISFSNFAFEIAGGGGTISIYDGSWRATGVTGMGTGWHHVAVTNDLSNFVVYVDGVQVYTKAAVARDFTGQTMFIGAQGKTQTQSERFPGQFDEVRVWNRALSAIEISIVKNQQLVGNESGLIAYYDFNAGVGTNKVSGGNYNLTLVSSPVFTTNNFEDYIQDFSLSYDGSDDKVSFATPLSANADFTLETQFKTTTANSYYRRFFGWTSYGFEVAMSSGKIATYKGTWATVSNTTFNDGQWHHLALTKSGTTLSIYVDGNLLGTRTVTLALSGTMVIGGSTTSATDEQFSGQLDEVRIWNIVRTQPEIEANMNGELAGNESGLIHYFDFNTPSSSASVANLVSAATSPTRTGATGTNNLPQYTMTTKNSITTSVAELFSSEKSLLSVYPNPVSSVVNLNTQSVNKIVVFNVQGQEVLNVQTTSKQLDLSVLEAGTYFLNVYDNEAIQNAIIVKQ